MQRQATSGRMRQEILTTIAMVHTQPSRLSTKRSLSSCVNLEPDLIRDACSNNNNSKNDDCHRDRNHNLVRTVTNCDSDFHINSRANFRYNNNRNFCGRTSDDNAIVIADVHNNTNNNNNHRSVSSSNHDRRIIVCENNNNNNHRHDDRNSRRNFNRNSNDSGGEMHQESQLREQECNSSTSSGGGGSTTWPSKFIKDRTIFWRVCGCFITGALLLFFYLFFYIYCYLFYIYYHLTEEKSFFGIENLSNSKDF